MSVKVAWLRSWMSERKIYFLVLSLALLARIPFLDGSFWLDEAAQALESTRPLSQQLSIASDFQPPFFHLLVHGLSQFSYAEAWLRLASLVPGLLSIAIAMELARRWWGKVAMGAVGLLLATSSLHVYFSQELRPYMLAVSLCLLALFLLESWAQESFVLKKHWFRASVLGGVVALALYSSYVTFFWWPGVFLASLLFVKKKLPWIVFSGVVALLLFLPWGFTGLRDQLSVGASLRETLPGWDAVVSLSAYKSIPLVLAKFLSGVERVDLNIQYAVVLLIPYFSLLALVFWEGFYKKNWSSSEQKRILWLGALLVLPLSLAWVFSLITPVIAPKRVLYLLPLLFLLVGSLFSLKRKVAFFVFVTFMSWNIWSLGRYWSDPQLQRENWRQVVHDLAQQFPPNSTSIVMSLDEPLAPWRWYTHNSYRVVSTGLKPLQSTEEIEELLRPSLNVKTIIVFDYLRDLSDPYKVTEAALVEAGYQEKGVLDYPNIGFVRVYMQDRLYAGVVL